MADRKPHNYDGSWMKFRRVGSSWKVARDPYTGEVQFAARARHELDPEELEVNYWDLPEDKSQWQKYLDSFAEVGRIFPGTTYGDAPAGRPPKRAKARKGAVR